MYWNRSPDVRPVTVNAVVLIAEIRGYVADVKFWVTHTGANDHACVANVIVQAVAPVAVTSPAVFVLSPVIVPVPHVDNVGAPCPMFISSPASKSFDDRTNQRP
jgi:hypothetical protein